MWLLIQCCKYHVFNCRQLITPKVNLGLYMIHSDCIHAITSHNFVHPSNGVHGKNVDFDWRQVKSDQNERGKISKPIWTRGCGGSLEFVVMTLQLLIF